jgi:hypothetical protein
MGGFTATRKFHCNWEVSPLLGQPSPSTFKWFWKDAIFDRESVSGIIFGQIDFFFKFHNTLELVLYMPKKSCFLEAMKIKKAQKA